MSDDTSIDKVLEAMAASRAAAGPVAKDRKPVTMDEFQKVLDSTPLFMRETPENSEDNYVLEALKSLVFEGEGDEIALNFKNHGNELYAQKSYRDAITAYTQGIDAGPKDEVLRISLLNNRAACNIALKNYGAVLRDTSIIIALAAKGDADSNGLARSPPPKAMYRAAQSLVALERWEEARDVIARGKVIKGEEKNTVWEVLAGQVDKGERQIEERKERVRRETLGKEALRRAVQSRGLIVVNTPEPPDNPNPLAFDKAALQPEPPLFTPPGQGSVTPWTAPSPHDPLIYPVFLLYPQHNMSDLITHFHENTSFDDQLAVIFPADPSASSPPWSDWDVKHEYYNANLAVYVETSERRLLKIGKEILLREVIDKARREAKDGLPRDGVVLRDGLLSFVVLVKGKEERDWIENFKKIRDQRK